MSSCIRMVAIQTFWYSMTALIDEGWHAVAEAGSEHASAVSSWPIGLWP